MTTESYTETSVQTSSDAAPNTADGTPVWAFLVSAIAAMVLIYIVTVNLQKIAAKVDKLLGREQKPESPVKSEDYKVNDIYEVQKDDDKKSE